MASSAKRVSKHRETLRAQGLRPVQLWLPDTRAPGFAEECRDWALSLKDESDEAQLMVELEALAAQTEGWVWDEET